MTASSLSPVKHGRLGSASNPLRWRSATYADGSQPSKYTFSIPLALHARLRGMDEDCAAIVVAVLLSGAMQLRGKMLCSGYTDIYIRMSHTELAASGVRCMRKLHRTLNKLRDADILYQMPSPGEKKPRSSVYRFPLSSFLVESPRRHPRGAPDGEKFEPITDEEYEGL